MRLRAWLAPWLLAAWTAGAAPPPARTPAKAPPAQAAPSRAPPAGSAPEPPAVDTSRPTFTWDVPRVLESVDVPDIMRADGIPVKLRSVRSAERPEVILQHLVNRFEQAGFFIPPDSDRTQWLAEPQLTALDPRRLISYTFFLQPNRDGTTTVVLGEANLAQARQAQRAFAPVYPGGSDLMQSDMEGARTLSYIVAAEPSKILAFYTEEFRAAGYSDQGEGSWRQRDEELRLSVRPAADGRTVVILMRRMLAEDGREAAVREVPRPAPLPAAPSPAPPPAP